MKTFISVSAHALGSTYILYCTRTQKLYIMNLLLYIWIHVNIRHKMRAHSDTKMCTYYYFIYVTFCTPNDAHCGAILCWTMVDALVYSQLLLFRGVIFVYYALMLCQLFIFIVHFLENLIEKWNHVWCARINISPQKVN